MNHLLFVLLSFGLVSAYAQPEDCSKLKPGVAGMHQVEIKNLYRDAPPEAKFLFLISHEYGEVVPLKTVAIEKKDFEAKVKLKGNKLAIDGKVYDASKVSMYTPTFDYTDGKSQYKQDEGIIALGCNNKMPSFLPGKNQSHQEYIAMFEKLLTPEYKKSN
jgi:hypothetical protein